MNLNLKKAVKKYIEDGTDIVDIEVSKEDIEKYDEYYSEKGPNDIMLSEKVSLSYLYNFAYGRYLDLSDDNKTITFVPENYLKPMSDKYKTEFLHKWNSVLNLDRVVISHAKCNDGMGVNAVIRYDNILKRNTWDIEYIMLDYSKFNFEELIPKLKNKLVYVGDFSFNEEQLKRIMSVANMAVIVDHHLAAFNSPIADYDNVHIDMAYSGAYLAWDFFFKGQNNPTPYVIKLIEDRDLWNFFYGKDATALDLALKREGEDIIFNNLTVFDKDDGAVDLKKALNFYVKEVDYNDIKYLEKAKEARPYVIYNQDFYGLNLTSGVSEILNKVSLEFNLPSFSFSENEDGTFQIALRNAKDDIDVCRIAKIFGGGGHKQASGSKINYVNLDLKEFFINKKLIVNYFIDKENLNAITNLYNIHILGFDDPNFPTVFPLCGETFSSDCCLIICEKENKEFEDIFFVTRDDENNLYLNVKQEGN